MTAPTRRVVDRMVPFVEAALDKHGNGEDIYWDGQLAPNGQGGLVIMLMFWLPGAVMNTRIIGSVAITDDPSRITEEATIETVRRFLEEMRARRSAELAQSASEPPSAPSGLILPGRR